MASVVLRIPAHSQMNLHQNEQCWQKVVSTFREACLLRIEGYEDEATETLRKRLPGLITTWNQNTRQDTESCRRKLRRLFEVEQKRVRDAELLQRLITKKLATTESSLRDREPSSSTAPANLGEASDSTGKTKPFMGERRDQVPGKSETETGAGIKHRVPIGSVSTMIDAVEEAEFGPRMRDSVPLRALINDSNPPY